MIDRLKNKLASSEPVSMCWSVMRDPQLIGTLARQDFDAVLLDAQHGFHTEDTILDGINQIAQAGKSALARIPVGRWDMAEKVLDFGALGVVAPMINTRQDAEAFATACKYSGIGQRSYGPGYAATLYGLNSSEYVQTANSSTLALAQIETREAYENLDDILSVEGIDGILMGPSDFSISMTGNTVPDSYGRGSIDAVADIAKRTREMGKLASAFTNSADHYGIVKSLGYQLISIMIDQYIVELGAKTAIDAARS